MLLASLWHNMFVLDSDKIGFLEKALRPVLVYVFLIIGLRIAGKRELAQLNSFDLIVLLMLSNTIQNAIIGDDNTVVGGVIGAAALLATNYLVVRIIHRSKRLDRLLAGRADVLMRDGRIMRDHLDRELITHAELTAAAHKQGIPSLHEVERCVLEPTGTLTFIQKRPGPDDSRHSEIMELLNSMAQEIQSLRAMASRENGKGTEAAADARAG
ncbi:MAG TPA: YetF domain-containing protein [Tepidisphaeraceae bacterium]|jgi:uncharacterized membrane protein YcaP (DUF421 family)|nr:YetF domain-containing protein [Tepidisphaeraceae bacterium]